MAQLITITHTPKTFSPVYTDGLFFTVTTLTKVALVEGLEIDLVSCSASGTTHKVKKIESFVISNGKLSPSLERKIKFIEHR